MTTSDEPTAPPDLSEPTDQPIPLLFHSGRIRVSADRVDEAIVISEGRVLATGPLDDVRSAAPADVREIDLAGATVIPGLIDCHPHLVHFAGLAAHLVDLSDALDHADIVARIAARASQEPEGAWIMATPVGIAHYFIRRSWRDLVEGVLPGRDVLDRASSTHPIFIQAWAPTTPNVCVFNSAALSILGIDETSPDVIEEVTIHKDDAGRPTGLLSGAVNNYYNRTGFMFSLFDKMPPLIQPEAAFPAVIEAMKMYNALGVTTVYEAHAMDFTELDLYRALRDMGLLTVRAMVAPEAELCGVPWAEPLDDAQFDARMVKARDTEEREGDLLRQQGMTIQLCGPCGPGLMMRYEPYVGPDGEWTTAEAMISEDKARRLVEFCAEHRIRLNIVAASNIEHDRWLALFEKSPRHPDAAPWMLQHAFFMDDEHCRRYFEQSVDVTTSMSFTAGKGDLLAERIGERCLEDLIPLGRMLKAGLRVGCGSDWGPKNIFEQLWLAMTHRFDGSGRTNLGEAQRITREQAFEMWTAAAATVLGWEGIGTLDAGNHADLVVVDRDPVTCPLGDLPDTKVKATLLGGRVVHDTGVIS
jgi:predicted amidohydrolase YtcJ